MRLSPQEFDEYIEAIGFGASIRASLGELNEKRSGNSRRAQPELRATKGGPEEPRGAAVS